MSDENKLGEYLKGARLTGRLTLRAVEKATGISNGYLSQLESGRVRRPSPVNLHKLSELYRLPYAEVLEAAGYPIPSTQPSNEEQRFFARIGQTSHEEKEALLEYLEFIRTRRRQ
ncbi:MAG: helix-turn-helix transcriptional regulator [Gemmatimonadaceae bacterium]|nr:helix-turn-helix transcriptional regulator [Gemmatimonadaceae bacterium]